MNPTFLRNKNFKLLFAFLLIVLAVAPEVAQGNFSEICTPQQWLTFPMTTFQCALAWIWVGILKLVLIVITAVAWIPIALLSTILILLTHLLSSSLGPLLSVPILNSQLVVDMWSFVRDFANLFFILFFVLIGLSTILKIESYKFQKTLPLLIVMALLVNFSLVFVGLVVDIGNILTSLFLRAVEGKAVGLNAFSSLFQNAFSGSLSAIWNASWGNWGMDTISAFIGIMVYYLGIIFVYITIVLVLFVIIFIFLWRIAILWILAILSPLAFVSYIFETTRKAVWQRWLSALVKWSIVAVPILFFMFIGFYILHNSPAEIQQITQGLPTSPDGVGQMSRLIQATMIPLLSVLIMFIGVIVSMTILPEAAQSAIDAGKKTGSFIGGITRETARRNPTYNKIESGFMKRMESWGVAKTGTYSSGLAKDKKESADRIKEMGTKDLINALEGWNVTAPEVAAIMERLAEKGDLTPDLYRDYANRAELGGADPDNLLSNLPLMAKGRGNILKTTNLVKKDAGSLAKVHESTWDSASATTAEQQWQQRQMATSLVDSPRKAKDFSGKAQSAKKKAVHDYIQSNRNQIITELTRQGVKNPDARITAALMHIDTP